MGDSQPQPPSRPTASSDPMLLQQRISQLEAELRETKALMAGLAGSAGSAGSKLETTIEVCKAREEKQKIAEGRHVDPVAPSDVATPIPSPLDTATATPTSSPEIEKSQGEQLAPRVASDGFDPSLHLLLILSDSALPLGSFAFSSGLESYLTHHHHQASTTPPTPPQPPTALLRRFLSLSLSSLATTTLPFITAAYNIPHSPFHHNATSSASAAILNLSDTFDATTTCPVLRRASTTQGKALLSVWEKSLRQPQSSNSTSSPSLVDIESIITAYRRHNNPDSPPHLPIAWALISLFSNLNLHQTTFVFLLNHTKALLSAAVRLNLIGPYVAQKILASPETLEMVRKAQKVGLRLGIEDAGQTVPTLDLYQGRHELLYSRVFNS